MIVLPASYACCKVTLLTFAVHEASSLDAFRQIPDVPLVPSDGTFTKLLKIISPDPFGVSVKSSFVPVVMSVPTPLKVRVPVVVIAPELTVPIFVRLPDASILVVAFVWIVELAFTTFVVRVAVVPLSTNVSKVLGEPFESLMVKVAFAFDAPSVTTGTELEKTRGAAFENVFTFEKELA